MDGDLKDSRLHPDQAIDRAKWCTNQDELTLLLNGTIAEEDAWNFFSKNSLRINADPLQRKKISRIGKLAEYKLKIHLTFQT